MLFERFKNIFFDRVFQIDLVSIAKTGQFGNLDQVDLGFRPIVMNEEPSIKDLCELR